MNNRPSQSLLVAYGLPAGVFLVLVLYSYAKFFEIPYIGFEVHPATGTVIGVFSEDINGQMIQMGDRIIQAGTLSFEAYRTNLRQPLFQHLRTGDMIPLTIQRDDHEIVLNWVVPDPTAPAILDRLFTAWLPYMFWAAGTASLFFVRPRDIRWRTLTAYFYLTAVWVATGLVSAGSIWYSPIIMRMAIWMCVPVYLHLHWVFPRPLGNLPGWFIWVVYLGALGMAGLEWFQVLPQPAYFLALVIAGGGSIALLVIHAIRQPDERRGLMVMGIIFALIVLTTTILGTQGADLLGLSQWSGRVAIFSLPALPGAYFYVIYRRRLGGLELRTNRLISLYMLLILLFIALSLGFLLINNLIEDRGMLVLADAMLAVMVGFTTAIAYPNFQRWVESHLLGMPFPRKDLLETYASRITTSLDIPGLVHLIKDEILPSLLVRQSALLRFDEEGSLLRLYATKVEERGLPSEEDIPSLMEKSGIFLPTPGANGDSTPLEWIRVILPLVISGKLIGLWLLGNRDPDDYYAQSEISSLRAIANQTAIALVNITQAERLRALYQADIERHEKERANLARGLHDEVLNQLAALALRQDESNPSPGFQESHEVISGYLRGVIAELRPAMLAYGLRPALDELAEQLSERIPENTQIQVEFPYTDVRYDPHMELHLFRIVQQAFENSLRHSHARNIRIHGVMEPEKIQLIIEDDGVGFPTSTGFDLSKMLMEGHYGLVGMYERAAIIEADLDLKSKPGAGMRVEVNWQAKN